MEPGDLERLIARELGNLPPPQAPRTLLPRIMAAVDQAAARPWYARPWLTWPSGWQAVSAVALLGMIAAAAPLLPAIEGAITALPLMSKARGDLAATTHQLSITLTAVQVIWRALLAPVVPYAFGLVALMLAACAIFGLALNHLVFGKALQ